MVRLSWALVFASIVSFGAPEARAQEGAGALTAPEPGGATTETGPDWTDIPPPPPGYGSTPPPGYGTAMPPPPGAIVPPHAETPPPAPADPDKRSVSEMVELYVTGSMYGLLTGGWFATLAFDGAEAVNGTIPMLAGAGGALAVFGADSAQDGGFRTGVPASISMGLTVGALEGLVGLAAFERDMESEESAVTLVWGLTTVGGAGGALLGSWLRPSIGDTRLVASAGVWGAYFAGLAALAAGTEGQDAWRWVLAGLNAGLVLGMVAAPVVDLTGGRVMLLHAGIGGGALAGFMIAAAMASPDDLEDDTTAVVVGVGSALGLAGMFLLVRPRGGAGPSAESSTAWSPYVSPVDGGGIVGVHAAL